MISAFLTNIPPGRTPVTRRPATILADEKPAKIARFAAAAGWGAGDGRSSSVCSAMISFSFGQGRRHDLLAAQNDQSGGNQEMCGDEDVLECRAAVRRRGDVAGRQIVELVHGPIDRQTPERPTEER